MVFFREDSTFKVCFLFFFLNLSKYKGRHIKIIPVVHVSVVRVPFFFVEIKQKKKKKKCFLLGEQIINSNN